MACKYFRDESKQEPVVVGTMPGQPAELGTTASGFYDPNSRLDENGEPTGVSVYPKEKDEPDVNRLAVNNSQKEHNTFTLRKAERITDIPTADFDEVGSNIKGERYRQLEREFTTSIYRTITYLNRKAALKNMTTLTK